MGRMGWYAARFRSMSVAELGWRASRAAGGNIRRLVRETEPPDDQLLRADAGSWPELLQDFRASANRPVLLDRDRAIRLATAHPAEAADVVAAAGRALAHRFSFFGYPEVALHGPIDWHADPLSGTRWPAIPASRIDHRTSRGDPKWIWELNRLQHLPWLAQAWLVTGEDRYAGGALDQLDSWLRSNPPGVGIAWRGAFEAGVRAISVAVALQGLRDSGALTPNRYRRTVHMLAASARRCWADRSRFSSANNHLVGELAGLATVALLFPEIAAAGMWKRRALSALAVQAERQILPDGCGAEQAVGYQVFTGELLLVVSALLRLSGEEPPAPIIAAVDRSATLLATLVGDSDPAPRYGDDDEGFALRLGAAPVRALRNHLGAVAAVTGNRDAQRCGHHDLTAGWLAVARGGAPACPDPGAGAASAFAPDGGLVVLRSGKRRVMMDVGPLGHLSIAAHGHADALAVTVSANGRELIGDPGAASYYGHPGWRRVHRGTRAHATVTVDETDQSVAGGPFLWTRHARVTVHTVDLEHGIVDAEHDGYQRLAAPVTHRRWLLAPPGTSRLVVVDQLTGRGTHQARLSWPLHPSLQVQRLADGHLVTHGDHPVLQLAYAASVPASPEEVRGDDAQNLGWWSQRLESREPSWLVGLRCRGCMPLTVVTVLAEPQGLPVSITDLSVRHSGSLIEVGWQEANDRRHLAIDSTRPASLLSVTLR